MARVNWMEFRELVPSKINTVLIPTGTLEPHGVANNGADITAPEAMARSIAPKVNAMIARLRYAKPGLENPHFVASGLVCSSATEASAQPA